MQLQHQDRPGGRAGQAVWLGGTKPGGMDLLPYNGWS